jgi:hypothetical protein
MSLGTSTIFGKHGSGGGSSSDGVEGGGGGGDAAAAEGGGGDGRLPYRPDAFHLMFAFASMYMGMLLTNWQARAVAGTPHWGVVERGLAARAWSSLFGCPAPARALWLRRPERPASQPSSAPPPWSRPGVSQHRQVRAQHGMDQPVGDASEQVVL